MFPINGFGTLVLLEKERLGDSKIGRLGKAYYYPLPNLTDQLPTKQH